MPTAAPILHDTKSSQPINELKSTYPLVLQLPEDLITVTKHYVDFVRREDVDSVNAVKKCMEQQWSTLVQ